MQLAENSVRKRNPDREIYGRVDGLRFLSAEEAVRQILSSASGKALFVSDGTSPVFAAAASSPRAISAVFDGDCLPLFSMPDGVSCVLGLGKPDLLRAVRYFAEVRNIPCTLFPVHASLAGAFEGRGEVFLNEEAVKGALREGEIVCDCKILQKTLSGGYGRILLTRLAEIENRALGHFTRREQVFQTETPEDLTAEEIILANARQRVHERDGMYAGEGVVLSEILRDRGEKNPEWRAFVQLSALYAAFFEKGKPRRYFTPDYRGRAARAGTQYAVAGVPPIGEYVYRAMTLERIRASFAGDAVALLDGKEKFFKEISEFAGEPPPPRAGDLSALKMLPEHAPYGLSAIIRDFGLMEWEI